MEGAQLELVASTLTNSDGRCDAPLLQGDDYRSRPERLKAPGTQNQWDV